MEADQKFRIEIDGFDMHNNNFTVTLSRGKKERTFQKSELIEDEVIVPGEDPKYDYYLCFNNDEFGPGTVMCTVRAWAPDSDFPNGMRKYVDQFIITIAEPLKK